MTFLHSMTYFIEGITVTAPLKWRMLDGIVADFWQAEGRSGGGGRYISPDPRIMVFFSDVGSAIRIADRPEALGQACRPMARVLYVPAGAPLCSRFVEPQRFQHLDLHLDARALHRMLAPALGGSAADAALRKPVELAQSPDICTLAELVVQEVSAPQRHPLYAESLVRSIATGILSLPAGEAQAAEAGLTNAQMRKVRSCFTENIHRRIASAELAAGIGLSESWFTHLFKQATGETPLQWQSRLRVERAQELLATTDHPLSSIAIMLGFADQAHMTRVFRNRSGTTPAAWRRAHRGD